MSGVTHIAVGALLGVATANPAGAFSLGVLSHLVIDSLPHNEWFPIWGEIATSTTALVLLAVFAPPLTSAVFWGALGAAMPDLEIVVLTFWRGVGVQPETVLFHRLVRQPAAHRLCERCIQLGLLLGSAGLLFLSRAIWT